MELHWDVKDYSALIGDHFLHQGPLLADAGPIGSFHSCREIVKIHYVMIFRAGRANDASRSALEAARELRRLDPEQADKLFNLIGAR